MKKPFVLIFLSAFMSLPTSAAMTSGNDLYGWLTSQSNFGMGAAYVMGVADVHYGINQCAPKQVNVQQIADTVKKLLEENPSVRHLSAHKLVSTFLKSTWPCVDGVKTSP